MKSTFIKLVIALLITSLWGVSGLWAKKNDDTEKDPEAKVEKQEAKVEKQEAKVEKQEVKKEEPVLTKNPLANKKEGLRESIEGKSSNKYLSTANNSVMVDLHRELEMFKRERTNESDSKNVLGSELDGRLVELKQLKEELSRTVEKKKKENTNFALLVTLYESIKPDEAVELLKKLPLGVSVEMVKKMNPKKSSKLLAAMEPKMAAEISRRILMSSTYMKTGGR